MGRKYFDDADALLGGRLGLQALAVAANLDVEAVVLLKVSIAHAYTLPR